MISNDDVGKMVLNCAMSVHTALGPGLLESAYEACMAYELSKMDLRVERQVAMPVRYKSTYIYVGYRLDLLVNKCVVIELKVVERLGNVHLAQILSYLRLGNYKLGYLLNFNVSRMKDGIKRVVN